ncbi:MAG: hypothetical protein IT158_21020 [Bryobacterales bacterium]|nr:hypothetical protein [Bryobacterales bacterium]
MPPLPVTKIDIALTKYGEPVKNEAVAALATPFGPGYEVLFDLNLPVNGWKEIRVWVHVFVDNYAATPVTANAKLEVRLMHNFTGGSFDYEKAVIGWNGFTSYINGYLVKPVIGKEIRLLCHPVNLPPPPYRLTVTYLLIR